MSAEENKARVRRFVEEGLNKRNPALIDEFYAPDYVGHDPDRPQPRSIEDLRQVLAVFLATVFPDARYTIEDLVAEGDRVWWHWTFSGTHQGEFLGIAPTGKQVSFGGVNLFRFGNGNVVEDWVYRDTLGMLRQLGLMPPLGQAGGQGR